MTRVDMFRVWKFCSYDGSHHLIMTFCWCHIIYHGNLWWLDLVRIPVQSQQLAIYFSTMVRASKQTVICTDPLHVSVLLSNVLLRSCLVYTVIARSRRPQQGMHVLWTGQVPCLEKERISARRTDGMWTLLYSSTHWLVEDEMLLIVIIA